MARLSLEQKVRLLTGADFWSLHAEPAVGLRRVVLSDGPAGVRGETMDERDTSANVPSPTALAATWDEAAVERLGGLLAFEARRKGVDVLLAPTVNLHRTPFGGRHFECLSEDPLLTARIGAAFVRGVQGGGVAATVKHFVANDSETERMTVDVRVGPRALRELYLAPFEAIVRDADPWAVMCAYNGVNGEPMSESPLLRSILHDEWGFDGIVMSDWTAARTTEATARAALDLAMPGPDGPWGDALVAAVREGRVSEAAIDDKVERILRLAGRVGAIDGSSAAAPPAFADDEIAAELRSVAAAGFVLARNEGVLPLDRGARVAVLGPNAAEARTLGGGSATVFPPYTVSPLEGLRAALGAVDHAVGVHPSARTPVARLASEVRFVATDGTVLATEERRAGMLVWMDSFGHGLAREDVARIEVRARLAAGGHRVGASGLGRFRLSVGGEEVLDVRIEPRPGADVVETLMIPPQAVREVEVGEESELLLVHDVEPGTFAAAFQLNLEAPRRPDDEEIEGAVALAAEADVAVVVVGTTAEVESEGFDRTSLALPGRQDELVRRVAAANPRTIAVVNAGAPVLLPWADEVAAVLLAWFPGQEFGNALVDVLLGVVEPGGRLPTTWPATEEGLPSVLPVDGVLAYDEGLRVGYRAGDDRALYPFGHGLGYTTWDWLSLEASPERAVIRLRNTGERRGREVVQLYASRPDTTIDRPARWLVAFAAASAHPGEEVTVTLPVPPRAFQHWDEGWATEPGTFQLAAGPSSAALPLEATVTV
jgi:beta-glucosidase